MTWKCWEDHFLLYLLHFLVSWCVNHGEIQKKLKLFLLVTHVLKPRRPMSGMPTQRRCEEHKVIVRDEQINMCITYHISYSIAHIIYQTSYIIYLISHIQYHDITIAQELRIGSFVMVLVALLPWWCRAILLRSGRSFPAMSAWQFLGQPSIRKKHVGKFFASLWGICWGSFISASTPEQTACSPWKGWRHCICSTQASALTLLAAQQKPRSKGRISLECPAGNWNRSSNSKKESLVEF